MADEDLIFRLEGVDGGGSSRAGHDGDPDTDSDDDEGYFICPITDDPMSNRNVSSKVQNYYSNLAKTECGSTGSPAGSFHFKVSGRPFCTLCPAYLLRVTGTWGSLSDVLIVSEPWQHILRGRVFLFIRKVTIDLRFMFLPHSSAFQID